LKQTKLRIRNMHNFRKLEIWKQSVILVTEIYKITNTFPSHERFGLM
jgi:hypothetical protein